MTADGAEGSQESEEPRRFLIATTVSRYPRCADWDRPGLVEARAQIVELFTQHLGYQHHTDLGLDPTRLQLTDHLRAFCTSSDRRDDDLVVVYLSCHGQVLEDGDEHVLLMSDSYPSDVTYSSLPTADLVRVLRGSRVRRLLLLLDTCYSGQGGNELAAAALEKIGAQWGTKSSSGLVVVSSAQPHQQAQTGLFPRLLEQAVGSQATAGHAPKHLSVSAVVQQMNDNAARPDYQHISLSMVGLTGEPPAFFNNPRHDVRLTDIDLALQDAAEFDEYSRRRDTEFTTRLLVRAMGYHGDAAQGWWFCGRHRVLAELSAWLNRTNGQGRQDPAPADLAAGDVVRVVTAGPGSGKTAVLGLIAALALPERRRTVPVEALGLEEGWTPDKGSIDVVMYAQKLTNSEVLNGLAAAAGLKASTVGELLEALGRRGNARSRPFTVLIDALDEAATPDTLCSQIVRPLIDHSQGRIRLLLGTRPYLLDRLGLDVGRREARRSVIDLDSSGYADREALRAYTMRNLIESRRTSPYRQRPDLLRPVGTAVADAAKRSFLVARFAAYTLASADTVVADPDDVQWRASLPRHAGQAMRDDLTRRLGDDAHRAADLLRPLAYAEGQGLPWEGIWAHLATVISGHPYTDDDLLWLRRNAGSYVVEATENGRSAYRLYHQALTEHLREGTDPAGVHSAFVDTLTNCVPYRGDATRDWSRAHPYTLNHLATHAGATGRIDDILKDTEYLVDVTPSNLTPHLQQVSTDGGRLTAAVYRMALDLHAQVAPSVRRQVLALNAARAGATTLLRQLTSRTDPSEWAPDWATGSDFTQALRDTLTGHSGTIYTVACTALDGEPVAVTGGSDGTVRVWDLATGRPIGSPLTGHDGPVYAVACTVLDGTPIAVTGNRDGTARIWDLATGRPIDSPLTRHWSSIAAVACTVLDGTPIAVTAGSDGAVVVWDLATRRQISTLEGHLGTEYTMACTVLDGTPIAVIGSQDGTVGVWDLATGQQVGTFAGHDGPVYAVACTVLHGTPIAVTTSTNGIVRIWDLAAGQLIGTTLTGHNTWIRAIACMVLDSTTIAVIGSHDGTVGVWDLATGQQIGAPLTGPSGPVNAVACTVLDGAPVAITTGHDGAVRIWDLIQDPPVTLRTDGHSDSVTAVACTALDGAPVAVSGSHDGTSRVWNLATGQQIGTLTGHDGPVYAVACTLLDGTPVTVTTGMTGIVRIWDPATGQQIGKPLTRHRVSVHAVAILDNTRIAVTGDVGGIGRIWDLGTSEQIGSPLTGHKDAIKAVACTVLDGTQVAVTAGSDGTVRIWDLATSQQIGMLTGHSGGTVYAVACTVLDGTPIAVTTGWDIRIWDLATRQLIGEPLTEHGRGGVHAVACTVLEGTPIAVTGSGDGTTRIWDLRSRKPMQTFLAPTIQSAAFTHDGRLVVALGRDVAVLCRAKDRAVSR
ncbi:WD40 repeat domain-containing protein [Streptomyces mirabilis]|uniref:WD40 repeat domain-containing protein n=1 Tax=Streptomyces mirabilis TaxID=68239 RepID=UPI0033FB5F71